MKNQELVSPAISNHHNQDYTWKDKNVKGNFISDFYINSYHRHSYNNSNPISDGIKVKSEKQENAFVYLCD